MIPIKFPQCNARYGPPADLEESQCFTIHAYQGEVTKGSVDGSRQVVVAWQPTEEELERLIHGASVYISMLGGLAPHFLCTSFEEAVNVA